LGSGKRKSPDPVMLRLAPARIRRIAICGVLLFLSVWGAWIASGDEPVGAGPRLTLALLALSSGLAALTLWRATDVTLTLTEEALTDSRGRVLARMDAVSAVERGGLSLAPTGGFVLRLTAPAPAHWVPGVWWRIGTRVGVGGATPRLMTREMALLIEAMLAVRQR
jgi:hypothetical protein